MGKRYCKDCGNPMQEAESRFWYAGGYCPTCLLYPGVVKGFDERNKAKVSTSPCQICEVPISAVNGNIAIYGAKKIDNYNWVHEVCYNRAYELFFMERFQEPKQLTTVTNAPQSRKLRLDYCLNTP